MRTTEQLDLNLVLLVVVAPEEWRESLSQRALTLFKSAGLPLPNSGSPPVSHLATLTLTLNPQPIEKVCPDKILYAPSLALTEPVTVPRTNTVIKDATWRHEIATQVREPITTEQITADLDTLINQFITDYQKTNPPNRPLKKSPIPNITAEQHQHLVPSLENRRTNQHLQEIRAISLSVLAGQWSSALTTSAMRQLAEAGFRIAPTAVNKGAVSMSLELIQQALDEHCPGKVLYERGLYLVEEVRVTRQSQMLLWTDTWFQESARIVPPLSLQELEADQRQLLQEFIRAQHATQRQGAAD